MLQTLKTLGVLPRVLLTSQNERFINSYVSPKVTIAVKENMGFGSIYLCWWL